MRNLKINKLALGISLSLLGSFLIMACNGNTNVHTKSEEMSVGLATATKAIGHANMNMVEATAIHNHDTNEHKFILNSREVPAGWSTFNFKNASDSDHFLLLYQVPQQAIDAASSAGEPLLEHWYKNVTVPFQDEFNPYITGDITYGEFVNNLVGNISAGAPWFLDPGAIPMGGPGITSAGNTSETTINLAPGMYIVECYVKDENQEFHSYNGMLELMTVTESDSGNREPKSTASISVTKEGINVDKSLRPGKHNIAIQYGEQPAMGYEHLLGHNAQLVRLDDDYDSSLLEELAAWMDWTKKDGLVHRAPAGTEFIGGSMEMPGGSTAYLTVTLKPGTYAWIAEVPDPAGKNMLQVFSVTGQGSN